MSSATDPLVPVGSRFAVSGSTVHLPVDDSPVSGSRPFVLRLAVSQEMTEVVEPVFRYCRDRQVAVGADGVPLWEVTAANRTTIGSKDGQAGKPPQEDWKMDLAYTDPSTR